MSHMLILHCLRPWDSSHFNFNTTDFNWLVKVWDWGFPCSTGYLPNAGPTTSTCGPNAVLQFNHRLGVQIICLGFLWILRNVDKK